MSKSVRIEEVIITDLASRGNGVTTPYRRITQVFTKAGELIAEYDPLPEPKYEGRIDPEFDRGGIVGWCYDTKPNSKTDQKSIDENVVTRNFKIAGGHDVTMRFVFADKVVAEPTYTRADLEELADYFAEKSDLFSKNPQVVLRNWLYAKLHHKPEDEKAAPFHSLADYLTQHEFHEYDSNDLEWFTILPCADNKHIIQWPTLDITVDTTVEHTSKRFISTAEIEHIRDGSSKRHYARLKKEYR